MSLRWQTVDKWREERGFGKAELSRKLGGSESAVHRGVKHNSKLQPSTLTLVRSIFPEKFDANGEVVQ